MQDVFGEYHKDWSDIMYSIIENGIKNSQLPSDTVLKDSFCA